MKYIAAYVLLVLGGNSSPSLEDVTDVLAAVGVQADAQQLSLLMNDLHGKDIHELLASGSKAIDGIYCRMIVSVPASTTPRIPKYLDIYDHDCHSEPDESIFDEW